MKRALLLIALSVQLVVPLPLLDGCSDKRDPHDIKLFFERGKFGNSPDVGLMKESILGGEWDHVATIHGFANNLKFCQDLLDLLKVKFPKQQYACLKLNH